MNIKDLLKKIKRKSKIKITYTEPVGKAGNKSPRVIIIRRDTLRYIALGLLVTFTLGFGIYSFVIKDRPEDKDHLDGQDIAEVDSQEKEPVQEQSQEPEEVELPVIDFSEHSRPLETELQRINEPIPYGQELLYSAGNSDNIDEPVFQDLYLMNLSTGDEKAIAHTEIKFGEIYEGRFNEDWIAWLDTNQSGENRLYVMDRKTGEVSQIKSCEYNKPQLRLAGDNLVWVEQRDLNQDRLYLYNFRSGEPVVLELFNNPTYGTCPPSISEELLVWVTPSQEDPDNKSYIKVLDISKALSVNLGNDSQGEENTSQDATADSDTAHNTTTDETADNELPGGETGGEENKVQAEIQAEDSGVDPEIIDPKGFAIYPVTNGKAIAWLDNLDPSDANLKLTLDNGKTIIDVDQNVARPYGIGQDFIAYMKDDCVMVYFWDLDRYAQLNSPDSKARLTQGGVSENRVVWYSADNPNKKADELFISTVNKPTEEQLLGRN